MEPLLHDGMCRCCATEGTFKDFLTTFHWMGEEEIYADMLKDCFSISLITSEEINNGGICEVCITQLRNAANFRRQVLQTEEQFKKRLEDSMFKTNQPIKQEMSNDGDSDNNMSDDYTANDYELPIKVEKEEKPKKRSAKASTSKAKKSKTDEGEPSAKRVRQEIVVSGKKAEEILQNLQKSKGTNKKNEKATDTETKVNKYIRVHEVEKHRSNMIEIMLHSNATPIRCKSDIGYGCCFCANQYPDPAVLKTHTIEKHDSENKNKIIQEMRVYTVKLDVTSLKCNICRNEIPTIEELTDHLINEHKRIIYTDIKNHMVPFKFDDDKLKCAVCSEEFLKFINLTEHMNSHFSNYVCDVCGAGFVNRDTLRSHLRIHKTGSFTCDFCAKTFNTRVKMQSHINIVHKKLCKTRKCGYCKELFGDYHKKVEHLAKHHGVSPVSLKCDLCVKAFVNQNRLRVHKRRVHLLERKHRCGTCGMNLFSRVALRKHLLKHEEGRDFHCSLCCKSFARMSSLKQHNKKIHSKDCDKSPNRYLIIDGSEDPNELLSS